MTKHDGSAWGQFYCAHCKKRFLRRRSKTQGKKNICCSVECRTALQFARPKRTCPACGKLHNPRNDREACSIKCAAVLRSQEKNYNWKGGKYFASQSETTMVHVGIPNRYRAEYRLVVERIFGRRLTSEEYVIHIWDRDDHSPDNLFVCATRKEYAKRRNGSLPWPTRSNLSTYGKKEFA